MAATNAFDLLQQDEEAYKTKKHIGYVMSYGCRETEDTLADHRYSYKFYFKDFTNNSFMGIIPVGSKRLQFSYTYVSIAKGGNKIVGMPTLSRRSHLGMTAYMAETDEFNYVPPTDMMRENSFKFSVLCLLYPEKVGELLALHPDKNPYSDYMRLAAGLGAAQHPAVNRDIMAIFYAQLDMFMETFFGIDFRTTQTLDYEELCSYLRDLLRYGPKIMLKPRRIHLIKGLKKSNIPAPAAVDEDDTVEEDAFYGDEDEEFDTEPNPCRVLILKKMSELRPKITLDSFIPKTSTGDIEWTHPITKKVYTVVSFKENNVKFPMPDLNDIGLDDWHEFAVSRFVTRMFTKERHYFVLVEVIEDEINRFNASYGDEQRRLFPVRLVEGDTRRIVDLLAAGGVLVKEVKDGRIRVYSKEAWDEQSTIIDGVSTLVNEPLYESRPLEETIKVIEKFVPPGTTLTEEQVEGVHTLVTRRISFLVGPGGSGKTLVMGVAQRMLRMMYGRVVFLFVSFKNGIVQNMKLNFGDGGQLCSDPLTHENEYRTLDKVIWSGVPTPKGRSPVVVFVEECGQTCGAHLAGLFGAIDMSKVRNLIMIGDAHQRSPIKAGTPFRSILTRLHGHPGGHIARLTKVHRTDAFVLRERQDAILCYDTAKVFQESDDYSFRIRTDVPTSNNRMSPYMMQQFAQKIYAELNDLKERGITYGDVMGICPYNDYCEMANAVAAEFYFQGPDYLTLLSDFCSKAGPKRVPFYAVGMRVVFNKTKKLRLDESMPPRVIIIYSRGQVGIIRNIVDVEKPGPNHDPENYAPNVIPRSTARELVPHGYSRKFVVVSKRAGGDHEVTVEFDSMMNVKRIMSPGSFITGDRAQGEEYNHVVSCFPWGNNLASNDVFYTICSRPKKSLCVIGSQTHMERMILTPAAVKNWKLDDKDAFVFTPHRLRLEAQPQVQLLLEAGETQEEDEFGDDITMDQMAAMDEAIVEHQDKKIKWEDE